MKFKDLNNFKENDIIIWHNKSFPLDVDDYYFIKNIKIEKGIIIITFYQYVINEVKSIGTFSYSIKDKYDNFIMKLIKSNATPEDLKSIIDTINIFQ